MGTVSGGFKGHIKRDLCRPVCNTKCYDRKIDVAQAKGGRGESDRFRVVLIHVCRDNSLATYIAIEDWFARTADWFSVTKHT